MARLTNSRVLLGGRHISIILYRILPVAFATGMDYRIYALAALSGFLVQQAGSWVAFKHSAAFARFRPLPPYTFSLSDSHL